MKSAEAITTAQEARKVANLANRISQRLKLAAVPLEKAEHLADLNLEGTPKATIKVLKGITLDATKEAKGELAKVKKLVQEFKDLLGRFDKTLARI